MAWLDDRIRDHPKIVRASAPAFRHWALALCYCSAHGTEGRLDEAVKALSVPRNIIRELVALQLWDQESDGIWVHDWQEHNSKRDEKVTERRAQDRERQRRHRERVRQNDPAEPRDVTRDSDRDIGRDVTRDEMRDLHARARDHDQEEELRAAAARDTVTGDLAESAAAAKTRERLEDLGIHPTASYTNHELAIAEQWLDLAAREATSNPAGFVLRGLATGSAPSPRARNGAVPGWSQGSGSGVDQVARRRRFVEGDGHRLPADELEHQLGVMGAGEDELVELLDLAADLRRAAVAS